MWALVLGALVAAAGADEWAALRLWAAPEAFSVDSGAQLAGAGVAGAGAASGWRLRARLQLAPAWRAPADPHDVLLRLQLEDVQLETLGKGGRWRGARVAGRGAERGWGDPWQLRWTRGVVRALYAPADDPPHLTDYRRALASLLQFRLQEGSFNESDASGDCEVQCSLRGDSLHKHKRRCLWRGHVSADRPDHSALPTVRAQRVTLHAERGGLAALGCDEEHWVTSDPPEERSRPARGRGRAVGGLRLRAWQRLDAVAAPPARAPPASGDEPALDRGLTEYSLQQEGGDVIDDERDEASLSSLVQHTARAHEAGGGGDATHAQLVLLSRATIARATAQRLTELLQQAQDQGALPSVLEALALCGTARCHRAAAAFTDIAGSEPHAEAVHYLLALPRALPPPQDEVMEDVLRLAEHARDQSVRRAATLAAGGAARDQQATRAQATAERALSKCQDDECREWAARAISAAARDQPDVLLRLAGGGGARATPALYALRALADREPARLLPAHLRRLERLALAPPAPAPLPPAARALALDALLGAAAAHAARAGAALLPLPLPDIARALRNEPELLRYMWRRVDQLAERHAAAATHARETRRALSDLQQHAPRGGSHVLRRRAAAATAGWTPLLDSAQLADRGALSAGTVRLLAAPASAAEGAREVFSLHVWGRGLHALAGGDDDDEAGPAAGLEARAGGGWLRGDTLFAGRGELLGALWAGAGSTPVPAARALVPLLQAADLVPLCCGGAAARSAAAAAALALDAQATVSLWARTARAGAALRAGGAAEARLRSRGAGGALAARLALRAAPRLQLAADLDFYATPTLCVRADLPHANWRYNLTLYSDVAGDKVSRGISVTSSEAARSLALGRDNDEACRALPPADEQ